MSSHPIDGLYERGPADGLAVDGEAFFKMDEVGRRVTAHVQAGGAKATVHHGGHRALAVGPGNKDAAKRVLRLTEPGAQRPNVREPELDPELLE